MQTLLKALRKNISFYDHIKDYLKYDVRIIKMILIHNKLPPNDVSVEAYEYIVSNDYLLFDYLPPSVKRNKAYMMRLFALALKYNFLGIDIEETLRNDRDIIKLFAINNSGHYIGSKLSKDRNFLLELTNAGIVVGEFIHRSLYKDRQFIDEICSLVVRNACVISGRKDKALYIIKRIPLAYNEMIVEYKKDPEIAKYAMRDIRNVEYLHRELLNDVKFMESILPLTDLTDYTIDEPNMKSLDDAYEMLLRRSERLENKGHIWRTIFFNYPRMLTFKCLTVAYDFDLHFDKPFWNKELIGRRNILIYVDQTIVANANKEIIGGNYTFIRNIRKDITFSWY